MPQHRKEVLKSFAESVSVKGIPKLIKSKRLFLRILWLLAVAGGTTICLMQVVPLVLSYAGHETKISTQTHHGSSIFPDITVCNLNTYTKMLPTDVSYYDYMVILWNNLVFGSSLFGNGSDKLHSEWLLSKSSYFLYIQDDITSATMDPKQFVKVMSYETWPTAPVDKSLEVTQLENYTSFIFDPFYGPCYTFHPLIEGDLVEAFTAVFFLADEDDGIFSEESSNFLLNTKISYASGLRVLVHEAGTYPDMTKGINVAPGSETTLWTEVQKFTRLPQPYSECKERKELIPEYESEGDNYVYKYSDCLSYCMQKNVINKCGCVTILYLSTDNQRSRYEYCETYNNLNVSVTYELMNCSLRVLADQSRADNCDCKEPCEEIVYKIKIDSAPWPHEKHHFIFYNTFIKNDEYIRYYSEFNFTIYEELMESIDIYVIRDLRKMDYIKRNFVQLTIKMLQNTIEEINESPSLSFSSFMGSLGGLLNLWIGITFITLVELVEFLYNFICIDKKEARKINVCSSDQAVKGGGKTTVNSFKSYE